jgi:chitin disaccharide deacetylase
MKQLIVNADDLGADEARNAGIFEAILSGAVTSASILPNGSALEHALENIKALGSADVSFGLHVNLSEGKPICPGLRLLSGPDGLFLGKRRAHELLMRRDDSALQNEIKRELGAQMDATREWGVPIRHLDGHQHVHVFPAVVRAAVAAARENKIPWMRIPEEGSTPAAFRFPGNLGEEARNFSSLGAAARPFLKGTGVRAPDHFRGLYLKGSFSPALLRETLASVAPGLTELMVHPGRISRTSPPGPFSAFSTRARELELEILLHPGFKAALLEEEIHRTPFPCAEFTECASPF